MSHDEDDPESYELDDHDDEVSTIHADVLSDPYVDLHVEQLRMR